jgi:GNAT superfamily N-acetyltransferase
MFRVSSPPGSTYDARVKRQQRLVIDVHALRREELEVVSRFLAHRSPAHHRDRLAQQDRGTFTYLVAWSGDEPLGHVGIGWPDDRHPERRLQWGNRAIVHDLEVVSARRNEGIGRMLMLELEKRVRERGLAGIGLSTGLDEGYAAARHLYRALGYAEVPDTLHVESLRLPSDQTTGIYLEIVSDWTKTLTA